MTGLIETTHVTEEFVALILLPLVVSRDVAIWLRL